MQGLGRGIRTALVATVAAGILSGCFDTQQALTVAEDGSAVFILELAVDAAILSMGVQKQGEDFCNNMSPPPHPAIRQHITKTTDRGDVVCRIELEGSVDSLSDLFAQSAASASQGSPPPATPPVMSIKREGQGYRFAASWPLDLAPKPTEGAPSFDATPMMAAALSGRYLSWTVTAPKIVETSGKLSEDGRTAEYSFPLALGMQEGGATAEFFAVFNTKPDRLFGIF